MTEILVAGAVETIIDWSEVEWTPENVRAFFRRVSCDDDCKHAHSHFEEQRSIAYDLISDLQTGDADADQAGEDLDSLEERLRTICSAAEAHVTQPIPIVIHCPKCHLQHVDVDDESGNWATTRHHRKHLCKPEDGGCGHVWMPAAVYTVGVKELQVTE